MFWSICPEIPNLNSLDTNRSGSISVGFPCALPAHQPIGKRGQRDHADREEQADGFATLLPRENAQHQAAHAEDREHCADEVDLARARVRHLADEPAAQQHDRDYDDLEQERDTV